MSPQISLYLALMLLFATAPTSLIIGLVGRNYTIGCNALLLIGLATAPPLPSMTWQQFLFMIATANLEIFLFHVFRGMLPKVRAFIEKRKRKESLALSIPVAS